MRKTITLLIALLALCISSWATPVTWNQATIQSIDVDRTSTSTQTVGEISVTASAPDESECWFGISIITIKENGVLTFALTSGQLTSVVISCSGYVDVAHLVGLNSEWNYNGSTKELTWTGSAASVALECDGSSNGIYLGDIYSIDFTVVGGGSASSVTWNENDVDQVQLYLPTNYVDQTTSASPVKNITASLTRTSAESNNCQFSNKMLYLDNNGNVTFTSAVGDMTEIVITCSTVYNTYASIVAYLPAGWTYDPEAKTFTWSGTPSNAVSISGNIAFIITSIEFTLDNGGSAPALDGTITWKARQVSHVDFTYKATSPVIKNIILTKADNTGSCSFSDRHLSITNDASLTFQSIVGEITGIVIICSNVDNEAELSILSDDWTYDSGAKTLTWDGAASDEVTLSGNISGCQISSIEFTYNPASAPRIGQTFEYNYQTYEITGAHTVKMPVQTIYGTLDIPAFVEDGSVTYYVTEIADNAFKDNNELSNAYIGENIARIGAHAFEGCYHMYEAQTNSYVVDEIGDEAFKDCKLMYAFSCYTMVPPELGANAFYGDGLLNHINVYYNALSDYQNATNWSNYNSKISEIGSAAAVGDRFFYLDQMTKNIYAVTSTSPKEAKVMPYTSDINAIYPVSREGSLIIPEKAYYMGDEYAITGIGANAYTGETGITMVIMPQNVKTIEAGAFLGCTNVEKVYFLWKNLSGITWADGAEGKGNEFDADTKIFVPKGMLATYQAWAPAWASRMVGGDVLDVEAAAPDPEDTEHFGQYYRTFYDGSSDYMMPAGVWAYAGYVRNNEFILRPIAFDGQTLPRRTAVVLGSQTAEYRLIPMGNDAPLYTGQNELRGTDEDLAVSSLPVADQDKVYVLGKEAWIGENRQPGMGMYKYTGSTLGAHKAYLIYNGTGSGSSNQQNAPIRFLFNREEQATGFENVQEGNASCSKILRDGQLIIIKDNKEYNAQGLIIK